MWIPGWDAVHQAVVQMQPPVAQICRWSKPPCPKNGPKKIGTFGGQVSGRHGGHPKRFGMAKTNPRKNRPRETSPGDDSNHLQPRSHCKPPMAGGGQHSIRWLVLSSIVWNVEEMCILKCDLHCYWQTHWDLHTPSQDASGKYPPWN